MNEEQIDLKCKNCGTDYNKPAVFKHYLVESNFNIFYRWSLDFCDKCRREKQDNALKHLPKIINAIFP